VSGTVRPQYMPDEPVTLYVYKDDRDIASYQDVHNFRIEEGGTLWIATKNGKMVQAWAAGAWDYFEAGAQNG
jgi:hypothetical protein